MHRDVKPANILVAARGRRRAHVSHGLRADQADRVGQRADGRRRVGRNARLRGSGAGAGRAGRRPGRHLCARLRALRAAHRPGAVRARRRHREALGAHLGPRAIATRPGAGYAASAGGRRRALHGEGSGRPLRDRRRDGAGGTRGGARARRTPGRARGWQPAAAALVLDGGDGTRAGPTAVLAPQPAAPAVHAPARDPECRCAVAGLRRGGASSSPPAVDAPSGDARAPNGPPVGTIDARIEVGDSPAGVGLEGDSAWVANEGDGTVTRIDLKTRARARGSDPGGQEPPGRGHRERTAVWVANFGGGSVSRIDAGSGRVVQTIPVGRGPIDIAAGRD